MTVLSRGARPRRGGRRPGWLLLTVLLVLAIVASSALVFTNRVELLKLAVILALWAAVATAFVSVIYRRQSDVDQAKARDLKLVYDLQLDREISARREYELTVESHLRRQIASELRAQSADEVAALRAELAALRTNLEILFDTELAHRPAIETERPQTEWIRPEPERPARPDRVASSRITSVPDDDTTRTAESPIIDVPEEPLVPPPPPARPMPAAPPPPKAPAASESLAPQAEPSPRDEDDYRGSHRRRSEAAGWAPPARPEPPRPEVSRPEPPRFDPPPAEPRPRNDWQPAGSWMPGPPPATENGHNSQIPPRPPPSPPAADLGAGMPAGSTEPVSSTPSRPEPVLSAPPQPPAPEPEAPRRGRHSSAGEPGVPVMQAPAPTARRQASFDQAPLPQTPPTQGPPPSGPAPEPPARHRSADEPVDDPPTGGQSAAELLARFQTTPSAGGRRRRRED